MLLIDSFNNQVRLYMKTYGGSKQDFVKYFYRLLFFPKFQYCSDGQSINKPLVEEGSK